MIQKDSKIKSIYTACVVLLPIFSVYASGIPGFTVGDVVLCLFFVLWVISAFQRGGELTVNRHTLSLMPLLVVIPVVSMLSVLMQTQVALGDVFVRIVRRVFYYFCVVFLSSKWFDFAKAKDLMIKVGKIGTIYLAIQYTVFYVFGRVLVGFLPFIPVYHDYYSEIDYDSRFETMFRPTSFLLEPAHFSRYLLIPLCIALFSNNGNKKRSMIWALLFTAAIIATTSGIGIIASAAIWAYWLLKQLNEAIRYKKMTIWQGVAIVLIPLAVIVLTNNSVFQSAFERIAESDLENVNTAGGARFRGFIQYFKLPTLFKIIGMGYGSTPNTKLVTWFSGASYILYGTGIFGFAACVYLFFKLFAGGKSSIRRVLVIIMALLFFADDSFMSHVAVVYLSFICFAEYSEIERHPKRNGNIR